MPPHILQVRLSFSLHSPLFKSALRLCLAATIEHSDAPKVKCPFKDEDYSCDMDMLEREIKALVTPAVLEKHQKKSVKEAEANIKNAYHCKVKHPRDHDVTDTTALMPGKFLQTWKVFASLDADKDHFQANKKRFMPKANFPSHLNKH